jgi:serine/threonine protein kinase
MTPGDLTDQPLTPGLRAPDKVHAPSARKGHEAGAVAALEPNEPTRSARQRLRLAVAARAAIDHPNLMRAWPLGEGDGRLFVAFAPCPHPSLTERLAAAPLEPTECTRILEGAAAGVDALSQAALVARDLTPSRVLLDPEHGCVLMDLGIPPELLRRVSPEEDPDLAFRSPEELERKPVDLQSGVYALGAMFFTALTGVPPGNHSARIQEARRRLSDRRIGLSGEIDPVLARALARDPVERYATPEALSRGVAAAVGANLAPKGVPSSRNGQEQQRLPESRAASLQRNGNRPPTAVRSRARPVPPADQTHRRTDRSAISPVPPRAEPRPPSRQAHLVATHIPAAARRCAALIATLLALAGIAVRRGHALPRQLAGVVGPMASSVASATSAATSRGAKVGWPLFLRACRLAQAGIQQGTMSAAAAASRALVRLKRSLPSVAQATRRRIDRFARDGSRLGSRLMRSGIASQRSSHRRRLLPAVGAIVASALSGIALGRAFGPEEGPSTVNRSGLTVQLPSGWEPAALDPGLPRLSSAIAAAPSGQAGAGFVAAKLRSLAAAERMLESVQRESDGRTRVRLGGLDAWQYGGLRLRPHVVGTGYLVPTTDGAVLGLCHAPTSGAPVSHAECKRAATTLGVRGERPLPLSSADRSNERVVRVIATLSASRSEGRRRLKAAELGRGQARAATSLKRSHERAARSLDSIAALENGHSLGSLSAALRKAAAAYGRLADAALLSDRPAYRDAGLAVVREEEALRRELSRTGGA